MKVKALCVIDNKFNSFKGRSFQLDRIVFRKGNRIEDIDIFYIKGHDYGGGGWFGWRLENGGYSPSDFQFRLIKYED